jgi:hypothetical protein
MESAFPLFTINMLLIPIRINKQSKNRYKTHKDAGLNKHNMICGKTNKVSLALSFAAQP